MMQSFCAARLPVSIAAVVIIVSLMVVMSENVNRAPKLQRRFPDSEAFGDAYRRPPAYGIGHCICGLAGG